MGKAVSDYRGLAARLNYMSLDCPDLQFPIKQCSREMSSPTNGSLLRLKKVVRYLVDREKIVWTYSWQDAPSHGILFTDSDWGGDRIDRKSTSGGVWLLGNHVIKTWSVTQGAVALSTAEAEFYAAVEGVTRAKGLSSLCREMGYGDLSDMCKCNVDSSAAKSFINRRGLGKMRHIDIRDLWLQKEAREGRLAMSKVPGGGKPR